jgi:hypothetical protein
MIDVFKISRLPSRNRALDEGKAMVLSRCAV